MQASELIPFLRKNIDYLIQNFFWILPKNEPMKKLVFNPVQQIVMKRVKQAIETSEMLRFIILKNRQATMSTLSEAIVFAFTILYPNYTSLVVAPDRERAQGLFRISQLFYDRLPPILKPMRLYRTKNEIVFLNPDEKARAINPGLGSTFKVNQAKDVAASRSLPLMAAHFSEAPYCDLWAEEVYQAIDSGIPMSPESLFIVESTANGPGNWFYSHWQKAKSGENGFIPIFIPWFHDFRCTWPFAIDEDQTREIMENLDDEEEWLVNEHGVTANQILWRRKKIASMGDLTKFHYDFPATEQEAFEFSGRGFFSLEAVRYYGKSVQDLARKENGITSRGFKDDRGFFFWRQKELKKVGFQSNEQAYTVIYKEPERGRRYGVGFDPSAGVGGDYCAVVVLSDDFEVVATMYSNETPLPEFVEDVERICWYYNEAKVNVEATGIGYAAVFQLKTNYRNWFRWEHWDSQKKRNPGRAIGWDATGRSVPILFNLIRYYVDEKILKIYSEELVNEISVMQWDEFHEKGEAPSSAHDDLVRALGLSILSVDQMGFRRYETETVRERVFYPGNVNTHTFVTRFPNSLQAAMSEDAQFFL